MYAKEPNEKEKSRGKEYFNLMKSGRTRIHSMIRGNINWLKENVIYGLD